MNFDLSAVQPWQWALGALGGLVIGAAKTGLNGLNIFFVPLMAISFGGRASTGIILPMLCVGDIIAVAWYRRHGNFSFLLKLMPWTLAGLGIGAVVGANLSDVLFKNLLGGIIVALLALMVWQDTRKAKVAYPEAWWFSALAGLLAGFTTMVGNAAGAVMSIYLLSMRLPKNAFIGTAAWFFLIVNLIKVPLQVFFWKTISPGTLAYDAVMIPAIAFGAFVGLALAGKIPERAYRVFVLAMTGIAACMLLLA